MASDHFRILLLQEDHSLPKLRALLLLVEYLHFNESLNTMSAMETSFSVSMKIPYKVTRLAVVGAVRLR